MSGIGIHSPITDSQDLLPVIYFVLDEEGAIQRVSQFGAECLNQPSQDFVGRSILQWVHPEERADFGDRLHNLFTSPPSIHRWEARLQRQHSPDLCVRVVARAEARPQGYCIHLVCEDLSEHCQTAIALNQSQAQLQNLLERAIVCIATFRIDLDGRWEYEYFSAGCQEVFGFTAAEFMADPLLWWTHVLPADRHHLRAADAKLLRGESVTYEYRFRHKKGGIRWISSALSSTRVAGQPYCYITAVDTDITEHKQAQRKLQESENQFRQLTENLSDVFWMMNPRTNRVLYISPNYQQMVGLSCEDFYQDMTSFLQVVHPEDREWVVTEWQQRAYSGMAEVFELRILHPQRGVRWLRTRLFPIRNAIGRVYRLTGIVEDITQRKQIELQRDRAEFALHHRELDLLIALDAAQMGSWECEPATGKQQWSTRTEIIFGFEPGTYPGTHDRFMQCVYLEDRTRVARALKQSFLRQTPYHLEHRIVRMDGVLRWVAFWGAVYWNTEHQTWKMSGVVKDITEQKLAEEALRAQALQEQAVNMVVQQLNAQLEQQIRERTTQLQQAVNFAALVKRITDAIRDSLDEGRILQTAVRELAIALKVHSCDTGVYDLKQHTSTICYEHICSSVDSAVGQQTQMESYAEVYAQLLQGQPVQFCWRLEKNGLPVMTRPLRQSYTILAFPLIDDQGVMGDMWLYKSKEQVFSDSEVRLVEQVANQCAIALRQAHLFHAAQNQVRELERLNQLKDDFLNTVSHELRTPMYTIKLATEMLEISLREVNLPNQPLPSTAQPDHSINRYLQIIKDECQKETTLIDDLLDLSRVTADVDPLMLTTMPLKTWLLHAVEPFVVRFLNQKQSFSCDCPDDLPPLTTDFHYLERVLSELLQNACKYTPANGDIGVTVKHFQVECNLEQCEKAEQLHCSHFFQIQISNSGVEIAPEERSRIFDKFYRIPNQDPWKYGGTGLGLALVKRRLQRIQGEITVTSGNGKTTFTIELPQWILEQ